MLPFMLMNWSEMVFFLQGEHVLNIHNGSIGRFLCTKKPPMAVFFG
jgi:hypothetical protein